MCSKLCWYNRPGPICNLLTGSWLILCGSSLKKFFLIVWRHLLLHKPSDVKAIIIVQLHGLVHYCWTLYIKKKQQAKRKAERTGISMNCKGFENYLMILFWQAKVSYIQQLISDTSLKQCLSLFHPSTLPSHLLYMLAQYLCIP